MAEAKTTDQTIEQMQTAYTLYENAIIFSTIRHVGQKRKYSGVPYICHPLEVSSSMYKGGCRDENLLAAAVLHDVLEDTNTTYEELVKHFNKTIADLVLEVTNTEEAKLDKIAYTKNKFNTMSQEACVIKGFDICCNLNDLLNSHENADNFREKCKTFYDRGVIVYNKLNVASGKTPEIQKLFYAICEELSNVLRSAEYYLHQ